MQTLEDQWPLDVDPNFMVLRRSLVRDDRRYIGWCLVAVVGAVFAPLWIAGWLWRHL